MPQSPSAKFATLALCDWIQPATRLSGTTEVSEYVLGGIAAKH